MRTLVIGSMLAFLSAAYAVTPAQPTQEAAAQPAAWLQHNLIVSLHDLPKPYTCNDLWYKFRDVLLAIGARADYQIVPYDCDSRSPQVQLNFMLPRALSPSQAQYADLDASATTVELQPGSPSTLKASDCDLVSEMDSTFFPAIPLKVTRSQLQCMASAKASRRFELSVAALTPAQQTNAALGGGSTPKSPRASRH